MPSSPESYCTIEQQVNLERLLLSKDVRVIEKRGGGNSLVYCVETEGKKYAVKSYPPYSPDQRDRLAAELSAYQFFNHHGFSNVPRLRTYCERTRWLIIDWIDGCILDNYAPADIEQAIGFIRKIAELNQSENTAQLPKAAEACLSLTTLIKQIEQRVQRLLTESSQEKPLVAFLSDDFMPIFKQCRQRAIDGYAANHFSIDTELPSAFRSLIPADFGLHNMIRDKNAQLHFFDFDYFGWDDPVKLLSDILWHPKAHLSEQQKKQFIDGIATIYDNDPFFFPRFHYNWSLFGLRWVLILLNEFIPKFWQNRQHALMCNHQMEAKNTQLQRAKVMLAQVAQTGC